MSKILVIERKGFLAKLARVAIDAHDEMFEDAEEMLNAFRTILHQYEQDVIEFEAEAIKGSVEALKVSKYTGVVLLNLYKNVPDSWKTQMPFEKLRVIVVKEKGK